MNKGLKTALATIALAQFLKIPIKQLETGRWDWRLFFETGGMPSSHSAGVSSLATFIALERGVRTIDFALAALFGLIVMYDAQGVRRQAGELALRLNELAEEVKKLEDDPKQDVYKKRQQQLRARLGHQPIEVVGGALLGMATGAILHWACRRRREPFKW
ncbi:divergent PAP2 family protein [Geobacillus stearothermophilus]|uniref:divergent PAP2 family protein n=1 Tax=Geobacillus stearothermophilus TaxID=1422 RepID=UPI001F3245FE|nr:divergent PAP2 family protein [Geobacillus stearothermophilus]MCK7606041.1 divergent PAP2 family protein [Geobacillus stearothermophilus]